MIPADPQTGREAWNTIRDALHLLGKFEDRGSLWPDGPEVFPGAVNRAYLAADVLLACGSPNAALTEDAREMAWLLRRCHQEARFFHAEELRGLLTAWTVAHRNEYEPTGQTLGETP